MRGTDGTGPAPAGPVGPEEVLQQRIARAERVGFTANGPPQATFVAKPRSHDDGPAHGMFLGPIGGPSFSRDLTGRFSRWHLHPGTHLVADMDAAFLIVRWVDHGRQHVRLLRAEQFDLHEVRVLYPGSHEVFSDAEMPFELVLSAFSPVIPGREDTSQLPVVLFDVHFRPGPERTALPAVDVALFWPNLCGWRPSWVTTADRGDRAWPGHHHAGNHNRAVPWPGPGAAVLQTRTPEPGTTTAPQTLLAVCGSADDYSAQTQFKTDLNATGVPGSQQWFTLEAVRHEFSRTGRLGRTPDSTWQAHWHEPVGSAVAAHIVAGRDDARARFILAFDWPEVRFGAGRSWRRKYAGTDPRPSVLDLGLAAQQHGDAWWEEVDTWHKRTLARITGAGWSAPVAGAVINELALVPALGTAWVDGTVPGHQPSQPALLPDGEHLGLLEGLDEGYFYYNTTDLWHYAFPALSTQWPRLGELVFRDLAMALQATDDTKRPVYRVAEHRQMGGEYRLPHDLGSPAEDPFVRLNGYVMRDDPNTWRDAGPAHILARLLHAHLSGHDIDKQTWTALQTAARVSMGDEAVPRHDEFGDSTWDNLALRGYSTYTASLCTGMWTALATESERRGEDSLVYQQRSLDACRIMNTLWNGDFFRAASEGKYTGAVMPDSIWGLFYAELLGARTGVPRDRIQSHLRAAYEICFQGYGEGRFGPLLIGERGVPHYSQDGGEELQVNEVLLGSAWMFTAMLRHYALVDEANETAESLRNGLYGGTGLQFRTPAAIDRQGRFRAPLNMRALAAWWLAVVE